MPDLSKPSHPSRAWLLPGTASGLLLTAAFPDIQAWPLAFAALVPLLAALEHLSPKQAFKAGFTAGFIHFASLIYWLVPTLTTFGNLYPVLALATLALLCLYLALYPALFALGMRYLSPHAWAVPVTAAALWTALEYLRTYLFTGFGWGSLGYALAPQATWLQWADLTGVLGLSFVLVLCNAGLAVLLRWRPGKPFGPLAGALVLPLVVAIVVPIYGTARMRQLTPELAQAPTSRITLVQGNIQQDQKWNQAFRNFTLDKYRQLSLASQEVPAHGKSDLVIWPETALPFYYGLDSLPSLAVDRIVRQMDVPLLAGSPMADIGKEEIRYFNRAHMISSTGVPTGHYDKTHLVPFGEYVPLQEILPFVRKITQEAGNYTPGETHFTPLKYGDHNTGVLICFEILFPGISRAFVNNGAQILTTMTNDAWFGTTSAPAQHLAVAVLRAVENRRSLARAANTGISCFIDPLGRVSQATPLFEDAAVTADLPILSQTSIYTRFGDWLPLACLIAMGLAFMVKGRQTIPRRNQP